MSIVIEKTFPVTGIGQGRPDYTGEQHKSKVIGGYHLELNESYLFLAIIACPAPGSFVFTRGSIAVNETINLLNPGTGLGYIDMLAGEDYLIKEMWLNFTQPMRWEMHRSVPNDIDCIIFSDTLQRPLTSFPIGWTRGLLENINIAGRVSCRLTNIGAEPAFGKCWIWGFKKLGTYTWL